MPGKRLARPLTDAEREFAEKHRALVYLVYREHFRGFQSADGDELIGAGNVALCRAAKNWRPTRGAFSTYACRSIKRAMWEELGELSIVRIPKWIRRKTALGNPLRNRALFLTLSKAYELLDGNDFVAREPIDSYENVEGLEYLLGFLSAEQRELALMRAQGLTLAEIGAKLGVSRQRIDQRMKAIRARLKREGIDPSAR